MVSRHQAGAVEQGGPVALLSRVPLFAGWSEADLRQVAVLLRPVDVPAGTVICREGEPGQEMYFIESGQVQVVAGDGRYIYAYLGPGDYFGEIALLGDGRRTATVAAVYATRLWGGLTKNRLDYLLQQRPQLRTPLYHTASERVEAQRSAYARQPAVPVAPNGPAAPIAPPRLAAVNERQAIGFAPGKTELTIGRHKSNDLTINDPQISRFHAVIRRYGPGQYTIHDLGSTNGVFINGQRTLGQTLAEGNEVWFGTHRYRFESGALVQFVRPAGVRIDAYHLTRTVGKGKKQTRILNDLSISIRPGEFVGVVGGSGAGKSTFLNALTGFIPADEGKIYYNGIDYYEHFDLFRPSLGFVPQDDIIHKDLTVRQVLHYAAQLRLPPDTTAEEREARIQETLRQLQLTERSDTPVNRLSGGQRKRVSIGVELLNQPELFFLDEPTSGLDPGLEESMMHLFRDLSRQGRTVLVITHATKNIGICDKVIFLARGGYLAFYGTPQEALQHFGVDDFTGIYRRLEEEATPADWARHFTSTPLFQRNIVEQLNEQVARQAAAVTPNASAAPVVKKPAPSTIKQFRVLTARYLAILRRDKVLLLLFFLQPPVIALVLTGMFNRDIFTTDPMKAVFMMFTSVIASIFLGAMNSSREITKENAIYSRERLVNLKIFPYVASKVVVLGLLSFFQAAVFLTMISLKVQLPDLGAEMYLKLYLNLALANLTGMGLGLLISSFVGNEDKATGTVPMVILPQMSLSGAMIPYLKMPAGGKIISNLAISRWAFENMGIITQMNTYLQAAIDEQKLLTNDYYDRFASSSALHFLVLIGYFWLLMVLVTLGIKRKDIR